MGGKFMYKIELSGDCFTHPCSEQTIVLWYSSRSEYSSLNDFINDIWTKQHDQENYGKQTLEEWFSEFHMEHIMPETLYEKIQDYTSALKYAEIQIPIRYTNAVRLKKETWDEVIYAAENEHDYICFWWYTTA